MSLFSTRIVGILAAATLVVIPLASASPASAATKPAARNTSAIAFANWASDMIKMESVYYKLDGRSTKIARIAINYFNMAAPKGFANEAVKITGLSDRNHDGLDDDGKLNVRTMNNNATLTLHKSVAPTVTDAGFIFKDRRAVLKESAQAFDRGLRYYATMDADTWNMIYQEHQG